MSDNLPPPEILSCPFCGSPPHSHADNVQHNSDDLPWAGQWIIECNACPVDSSAWGTTREQAVKHWNTRADVPAAEVPSSPCPYAEDGMECLLESHSFGPCLCANPVGNVCSPAGSAAPVTLESVADAIDEARYRHPDHPLQRPRPFSEADRGDREYAFRLARAALLVSPGPNPEAVAEIERLRASPAGSVHEFAKNYRFEFEDGRQYTPREEEVAMIEDAIEGYLAGQQ